MTEKIWLGGIYLKNEGGYEIILKSLNHYKKRLKTLDDSPEIKDSGAMFASILNQQAMKTVTKIHEMIEKILNYLKDIQIVNFVDEDISFLEKALTCYESDIHKAEDTGYEYFVNLVGNMLQARKDLQGIKIALLRINQFSD
jgi:hypothetical protein